MQPEQKETVTAKTEKKTNYVKKIFKAFVYVIVFLVAINAILYILLSIPFIQNKVLDFALTKIKEKVNTEVRIDEIRLSLFNNVSLKGVYIEDQAKDTLVYADRLEVSLSPSRLLNNELLINRINLENFTAKINQQNPSADFNFQFLIDAFATDTTATADTTSSSLKINIKDITLKNGNLRYDFFSEPYTPQQFNASHIHIARLNADLQLPSIDMADFNGNISSLSFDESSGVSVTNLKAKITSNKLSTFFLKNAELELTGSVIKIPSAEYNLITNSFSLNTEKSVLAKNDLLPFMADLKHLNHDIILQTSIKGKLPMIGIDSIEFGYGDDASMKASLSISDYSNYGDADFNIDISRLQINSNAISDFARIGDSTFINPDILKSLGTIRLEGKMQGRLNDMNIEAQAWARQGALQLKADAATDTSFANFKVNAKLQTQNFNLGSLLEMPEMGRLSGNLNLTASQSKQMPLKADVKGTLVNLQYNKQNYNNIPFTAYYNSAKMGGWLNADLSQGKLEAKVDMTQDKNPKIDIDVNAQKIQLDKFGDFPEWKNPELTIHLKGNIRGLDLKNIQADMQIDNLDFSHDSLSFQPGTITFQAGTTDSSRNYIRLRSSLLNANIEGEYDFMNLSDEIANMMNAYLPGMFKKTRLRPKKKSNNFDFSLLVNNTEKLGQILDLPVNIIDPFSVNGNLNTIDNKLIVKAKAPQIKYSDYVIKNTVFNVFNTDSVLNMIGDTRFVMESADIALDLKGLIQSDSIHTELNAKRDSTDLDMNINLNAVVHFDITPKGELISYLKFNPTFWDIGKLNLSFMPAEIKNEANKTTISNFGFMVGKGRAANRYLGIDGTISDNMQDTLNVSFYHANLGYILEAFDVKNISAIANGNIKLNNILDKPELYTKDMQVADIIIFNDTLGTLDVKSQWSENEGAIKLYAALDKKGDVSTVAGRIYPTQDSLNLKINFDRLSLSWLQPFMSDMLNNLSGSISTGLTATGKISAPDVQGWLGINDTYLGIDYTNVTYHISDTINISPEKIGFDNLIVEDPDKNKARMNAVVTHQDFSNMKYTLDANLNNFMVLNTAARTDSLFYGKVYASGTVNIQGSDDEINMNMNIRNGRNSSLNIQIPQTSDAVVYQSIVYINTPVEEDAPKPVVNNPETTLPLKLSVNLNITPDFLLGVIINPTTGDAMQAKGSGLIRFSYDMASEAMNAFGDYTLSDGFVKMKLQNIATVEFKIQEGSKLIFNGDPLKTNFNITAYKRVRADLRTLDQGFGSDQYNSPMVTADAVLGISGNMDKMNLTYDINLPEASDDVRQRVRSVIATDDAKVKQFASLVVSGSFFSNNSTGGANFTTSLLTGVASSALSAGLNSVLGNMIGNEWQIGTNFDSEDGTFSNMDMSVSLSRKFLDNRLEFNTNLGYRTDQTNNNSFIGDFDVSYALTRSLKLKVFNKTNDRYYKQAPTTQGIGLVYSKEAKTIKELFRFFRKKRSRQNAEQTISSK